MELGQPLLLTGEPGTGKTTFARHLATHLAPAHFAKRDRKEPERVGFFAFETKSTSVSTDLFYRFDSLRRFQAAHTVGMSADNRDYITFEALGKAIIESCPWEEVSHLVPERSKHPGTPRRSVVLIDEIDKAPRDFPNDLLNEIQSHFFRIPELVDPRTGSTTRVAAQREHRPIVVLTSNSEKNLPAPFLRRCVFHHIAFPERKNAERLLKIVKANLVGDTGQLSRSAVDFFYQIRETRNLEKQPTSHELISWITTLRRWDWHNDPDDILETPLPRLPLNQLLTTLGVIAKTASDRETVEALLAEYHKTAIPVA